MNKWVLIGGGLLGAMVLSAVIRMALPKPPAAAPVPPEQVAKDKAAAIAKIWVEKQTIDGHVDYVVGVGPNEACGEVIGHNAFNAKVAQKFIWIAGTTVFDNRSAKFAKMWNEDCAAKPSAEQKP